MIWLVLLLLACPPKRADQVGDARSILLEAEASRSVPVPAGPWEGRGLTMTVPAEWSGEAGLPDDPRALGVRHPSGLALEIWTWPIQGELAPRPRPGCEPLWADPGAWRLLPGIPVTLATACVIDGTGEVVEGYYAVIGDREVHIEVAYPAGRVIEGRERTEALLTTLRRAPSVDPRRP